MTVAGFIADQRTEHGVPHMIACRALGVSEYWFYKWRRRPAEPTRREVRRAELADRIGHFCAASGNTYGSPRITPRTCGRRAGKSRRTLSPRSWPSSGSRAASPRAAGR